MHEALALAEIVETDHLSKVVHPQPLCSGEPAFVTLWEESSLWGFDEKLLDVSASIWVSQQRRRNDTAKLGLKKTEKL